MIHDSHVRTYLLYAIETQTDPVEMFEVQTFITRTREIYLEFENPMPSRRETRVRWVKWRRSRRGEWHQPNKAPDALKEFLRAGETIDAYHRWVIHEFTSIKQMRARRTDIKWMPILTRGVVNLTYNVNLPQVAIEKAIVCAAKRAIKEANRLVHQRRALLRESKQRKEPKP